jgi:hypothetical protein
MAGTRCAEYVRIDARVEQCKATAAYLRAQSEEGLAVRRGAERYEKLAQQAQQEHAAHVQSCPGCSGQTSDWT